MQRIWNIFIYKHLQVLSGGASTDQWAYQRYMYVNIYTCMCVYMHQLFYSYSYQLSDFKSISCICIGFCFSCEWTRSIIYWKWKNWLTDWQRLIEAQQNWEDSQLAVVASDFHTQCLPCKIVIYISVMLFNIFCEAQASYTHFIAFMSYVNNNCIRISLALIRRTHSKCESGYSGLWKCM